MINGMLGFMGRPPKSNLSLELSDLLGQIGRNIAALREEKEITQADLARKAQVSVTTLNEIESRQFRDIRLSTLSSIAKALEVPVVRLLQKPDLNLNTREQAQLLRASEAIWKITRRLK